jgi:hypothetical protein
VTLETDSERKVNHKMNAIIKQLRGKKYPYAIMQKMAPNPDSNIMHPETELPDPQYFLNGLKARTT